MTNLAAGIASKDYPVGGFTSVFTGDEAFLADHIIQNKKILPGAAYLELARAAIAMSVAISNEFIIVLSESIFIQPLIVTDELIVEVKVYPGSNGEFGVEVITELGLHFQSKAQVQDKNNQLDSELSQPTLLDIAALKKKCTVEGPTKRKFYENFYDKGINLGPSHRGIEDIKLGDNCALIRVSLPGSSLQGMDLDPGMLDSFIQSASVLARNLEEGIRLPFAVKSTRIYGPLTDEMYAYLVKTERGVDYIIADLNGEVKVTITDFVGRDLEAQKDQLVFYKPEWKLNQFSSSNESEGVNTTVIQSQSNYSSLVKAVFTTAKNLIKEKVEQHTIEVRIPIEKPSWKGIIGTLKTIALEYPKIDYKIIFGESILSLDYQVFDMLDAPKYDWPNQKTILITGGLGGLGKIFAQDIAANTKGCQLVLVGRSSLDKSKKLFVEELVKLGVDVTYEACDLTQQSDVESLVSRYKGITGVIHGSGILNDNFISKKSLSEIEKVLAPKVQGLKNLDQATATMDLDYFITLSSIAGTLGNAGQTDYAAANGYMDAYMQNRALEVQSQKRSGKSISINWPLWQSEGMQVDEATRKNLLQVFKVKPLPAEQGLSALKQIIASEHQQMIVLFGNKKSIGSMFDKSNTKTQPKSKLKSASKIDSGKLTRAILQEVKIQTAEHIKRQPNQLDDNADWAEFGFDSILLSSFVNRFNSHYDLNLMPTVFFEATNIQLFSEYLCENHAEQMTNKLSLSGGNKQQVRAAEVIVEQVHEDESVDDKISTFAKGLKRNYRSKTNYREKDIAIVGMSCRIAGARNPDEFWQMLDEEKDMITEIPKERWDWRDFPESRKWGSFIDGVTEFDPLFFGISPAEATYINPEQRLIMQYIWECIEDAGCGGDSVRGTDTAIYVGCGASAYTSLLRDMPVEAYTATGEVTSVGPNRMSYLMDWHGPSNPVETACSSALVAIHRAVESIRGGHCEQAIAGGVNLLLTPHAYISFSKAGMLADDGRCKTFSNKANGYVRGEGVGMIMLKPLKQAIKDGNVIHALVKGTAENHGGRTNSLTAPNPKSQSAVIKKAVSDAGIDFSRVSYVECHGTGTELGDPVEIKGLKTVAADLKASDGQVQSCKLGSIKSNIGHLEFAAGVVGLIKVVLQMQHKKIAKSLHCENINPYIELNGTPFEIAQQACDWDVAVGQTRVAGVSSFGFGGVNAHVVLEEYQQQTQVQSETNTQTLEESDDEQQSQLIIISAQNRERLMNYVEQFSDGLESIKKTPSALKRIAYTLQFGRSEMQERLVFIVKSIDDWESQLNSYLENKGKTYDRRVFSGSVKPSANDNIEVGDTESGKKYIQELIAANEYEKIAELWVKGTKIDWRSYY